MNVLMLTQVLPYPPDSGPKVKTWNVIKYLAQRHEVTLASFVRGDQSEDVRHLERYCRAVHTVPMHRGIWRDLWYAVASLFRNEPFLMVRDDRKAMRDLVDRLTAEVRFDIAHADQMNMAQYAARVAGAGKILDLHNALWLLYQRLWSTMEPGPRRWMLGRDVRLLKRYEGQMCREFDAVLAVSEHDRAALEKAAGRSLDVTVVPIAVDTDEITVVHREAGSRHILHIGTMYWPPNVEGVKWFVQEVYPLVRRQCPDVQFDVVGSRPSAELLALNEAGLGVNVTGYVADPAPYLRRAALMVVPLHAGSGMRVKILNALAQGIPVVSTTLGAEGIAVTPGEDVLLADEPADMAAACLHLLHNPDLGERLARNGRALMERRYDYRRACVPLDEVYARAREL